MGQQDNNMYQFGDMEGELDPLSNAERQEKQEEILEGQIMEARKLIESNLDRIEADNMKQMEELAIKRSDIFHDSNSDAEKKEMLSTSGVSISTPKGKEE